MEVTLCYFAFLFVIFLAVFRLVKGTYDLNNKQTQWEGTTSRLTISSVTQAGKSSEVHTDGI
jgi:hypothetical protein